MSEGPAERKAALGGYISTARPVIACSSEIGIENIKIGAISLQINHIFAF